jgi:hypothetical protein
MPNAIDDLIKDQRAQEHMDQAIAQIPGTVWPNNPGTVMPTAGTMVRQGWQALQPSPEALTALTDKSYPIGRETFRFPRLNPSDVPADFGGGQNFMNTGRVNPGLTNTAIPAQPPIMRTGAITPNLPHGIPGMETSTIGIPTAWDRENIPPAASSGALPAPSGPIPGPTAEFPRRPQTEQVYAGSQEPRGFMRNKGNDSNYQFAGRFAGPDGKMQDMYVWKGNQPINDMHSALAAAFQSYNTYLQNPDRYGPEHLNSAITAIRDITTAMNAGPLAQSEIGYRNALAEKTGRPDIHAIPPGSTLVERGPGGAIPIYNEPALTGEPKPTLQEQTGKAMDIEAFKEASKKANDMLATPEERQAAIAEARTLRQGVTPKPTIDKRAVENYVLSKRPGMNFSDPAKFKAVVDDIMRKQTQGE